MSGSKWVQNITAASHVQPLHMMMKRRKHGHVHVRPCCCQQGRPPSMRPALVLLLLLLLVLTLLRVPTWLRAGAAPLSSSQPAAQPQQPHLTEESSTEQHSTAQ